MIRSVVPPSHAVARASRPKTVTMPGEPEIQVRVHRPKGATGPCPCVYSIHGGGYVVGSYNMDDALFNELCPALGLIGVSVEYRLAPETPYPGPLEDCYRGLNWTYEQRAMSSASTAAASASAASAPEAGWPPRSRCWPATAARFRSRSNCWTARCSTTGSTLFRASRTGLPVWSRESNTYGWRAYLGDLYGTDDIPYTAAPARAEDLSGLPPAYVSVGTVDGFLDEDVDYATAAEPRRRPDRAPPVSGRLPRLSDGRGQRDRAAKRARCAGLAAAADPPPELHRLTYRRDRNRTCRSRAASRRRWSSWTRWCLAEELGYERAWLYDSPAIYLDIWTSLGRLVERTSRIGLGTAVLVPSLRSVIATASAIATVEAAAPGRFACGFGTGATARWTLGKDALTLAETGTYLRQLRGLLRGEVVEVDGEQVQMAHLGDARARSGRSTSRSC